MPVIYSRVQQYNRRPDDDAKLAHLSKNLSSQSQAQFGIKKECQDTGLAPYFAAISALKSSCLCLTPTRKIFQIVRAAKLVFENLNEIAIRDHRCLPGAGKLLYTAANDLLITMYTNVPLTIITHVHHYHHQ